MKTLPAAIMYSLYTTVNKTEFERTDEMSKKAFTDEVLGNFLIALLIYRFPNNDWVDRTNQ